MYVITVTGWRNGKPFSAPVIYGPFPTINTADHWARTTMVDQHMYDWSIVELTDP
jgi:hypothetical protein